MSIFSTDTYSLLLYGAAFLAGLVDAIVGGGGLIQLPSLFAFYPGMPSATLFGTNKLAGLWGTAAAAVNFSRRVRPQWKTVAPAAVAAFAAAFLGAYSVTHIPSDLMRKLLPFILLFIAVYTFKKKDFGVARTSTEEGGKRMYLALAMGSCIGFYDGFFGPGTGSFLVFLFVRFFGLDFLGASAAAKTVNVACNFSALLWFGYSGHLLWQIGLAMAVFNVAGSLVGSRLAIRHGSEFVRKAFLLVVVALILKTSHDAFLH